MSRTYNMTVIVESYIPAQAAAIGTVAEKEWSFDCWDEVPWSGEPSRLLGSGDGNLCGGETEQQFVDRLTRAIWRANGAYCPIKVQAVYLDDHQPDCYLADEADYARVIKQEAVPQPPNQQEPSP